jgi:chromosome partitioning protein
MRIVSILNYKGGVGKTTLSACTGQALALTGFRVLAIDNDPQHNLSYMLGASVTKPTIRDVYQAKTIGTAAQVFRESIRKTSVTNLQVIPSSHELSVWDIRDPYLLQKCFMYLKIEQMYDFILIDNSPGMDIIQESAIHASDEIFVPTELSQFALNGIIDMQEILTRRFRNECPITKIIPNFYRSIKAHDAFLLTLEEAFPGKVTKTTIPFDSVFDTLAKEEKILFIHRLSSKAAAFYLKLMHELFDLAEDTTWEMVVDKRKEQLGNEARDRLSKMRAEAKKNSASEEKEENEIRESDHTDTLSVAPEFPDLLLPVKSLENEQVSLVAKQDLVIQTE